MLPTDELNVVNIFVTTGVNLEFANAGLWITRYCLQIIVIVV